jgi:hypothetical protein
MSLFWCFSFAMKQANKLARIKAEKWIENRLLCARVFVFFVICSRERWERPPLSLSLPTFEYIADRRVRSEEVYSLSLSLCARRIIFFFFVCFFLWLF